MLLEVYPLKVLVCSILVGISFVAVVILFMFLLLRLLMPKEHTDYFICVPCNKNTKNLRKTAYAARLKLNLCGENSNSLLVIVDDGICDEELKDTLEMCKEANGITLVRKEDLKDFINGRF